MPFLLFVILVIVSVILTVIYSKIGTKQESAYTTFTDVFFGLTLGSAIYTSFISKLF